MNRRGFMQSNHNAGLFGEGINPLKGWPQPGRFIPLTRGTIAIEYAEIWFRRIEVKAL